MVNRPSFLVLLLSLLLVAPFVVEAAVPVASFGPPMHFEQNSGQVDAEVQFLARGAGYAFFITGTETVAVLRKQVEGAQAEVVRMRLAGANEQRRTFGEEMLAGKSHYLIGNDPARWRTDVPLFAKVRQSNVYDGIDVVYYGNQRQVEYDFIVSPGTDPRQIRMRLEGAERIDIDAAGDLVLHIRGGELRQRAPVAYQERGGSRREVAARYRRIGPDEFGIALGAYDTARPLVIDPILAWSTYLGGSGDEDARDIVLDGVGNVYVVGTTESANFPTANAVQAALAGPGDAFITKMNAAGSALVYSTYLGGSQRDFGEGIAVDAAGNAYVTGDTASPDFPTVNPIQAALAGARDGFVVKLNPAGTALVFSTYLGGSGVNDFATGIAVDSSLNVHIAGATSSADFPTANAIQAAIGGTVDAFATKINAAGNAFVYSTFLGGTNVDSALGVATDGAGNTYVFGGTVSTDFPTANAFQPVSGGSIDLFLTKINAAGSALVYSTYLGGAGSEQAESIAVDLTGNSYLVGGTTGNFPVANAYQPAAGSSIDAFVAKMNAAGTALVYSTYLGGSTAERAIDVAVDALGRAFVTGWTDSADFPAIRSLQELNGVRDAFVTSFDATGSPLYSTLLGGSALDEGHGIAVDNNRGAYVAGRTRSADFPTIDPIQASFGGGIADAFVAKLVPGNAEVGIVKIASGPFFAGQDGTFQITVTNNGPDATPVTVTDVIPAGATFISATPSQGTCSGTTTITCDLGTINDGGSATIALVLRPTGTGPLSNTATISDAAAEDPNGANDSSTAVAAVGGNANLGIVKTAAGAFTAGQNGTYNITVANAGPTAATAVTVTDVLPAGTTFVSATPSQGSCSGTTTITCSLGTIANGGSATIALVVLPAAEGPLSNTATVASADADGNPANNASTVVVNVGAAIAAIPALDEKTLLLLAALIASVGVLMVRRGS